MKKLKQICITLCFLLLCNAVMSYMIGSAPSFNDKPEDTKGTVGNSVIFKMSVVAYPIPEFTVYKGGVRLSEGKKYRIESDGKGNYIFEIKEVELTDADKYTFILSNKNGQASVSAELKVSELPS